MLKLGGGCALPQSQKLFFGEVVLLVRLGLVREKAMVPAHTKELDYYVVQC